MANAKFRPLICFAGSRPTFFFFGGVDLAYINWQAFGGIPMVTSNFQVINPPTSQPTMPIRGWDLFIEYQCTHSLCQEECKHQRSITSKSKHIRVSALNLLLEVVCNGISDQRTQKMEEDAELGLKYIKTAGGTEVQ